MAPPNLRKSSSVIASLQTVLKSQKPKTANFAPKTVSPIVAPSVSRDEVVHPALVGVTSNVIEEHDSSRPNDYDEYKREKKRKAMEAEMRRELERRRQEEEERERKEREERERDMDSSESRLSISGEEAWRRRAAMSGGVPRSPSPPGNADGFAIGKSDTVAWGVGAGGKMTVAHRMMAKMGWKKGQGLQPWKAGAGDYNTSDGQEN